MKNIQQLTTYVLVNYEHGKNYKYRIFKLKRIYLTKVFPHYRLIYISVE